MAKPELHNWARYLLMILAIVFAGGGYAMKVTDNSSRISKTEAVDDKQGDQIHALQLADKDIANIAEKSLETMGAINVKLEAIQGTQTKQAVIQAVNSEKLKTLTKD